MLSALSFLANPKALIRTGLLIVAAVLALKIWGFVEDSIDAQTRVIEQEVVIQLKDDEIDTLNGVIEQIQEAQQIAEDAEREIEALEAELQAIRDGALSAGDDRDGPLAPVLQDTLRALRD